MIKVKNMTNEQFEKKIKECHVVCFCAGTALKELCDEYSELAERIVCVVDNSKRGEMVNILGNNIPIISVENAYEMIDSNMLVITSIKYADEIIQQLDNIDVFDGKSVYVPYLFTDDVQTEKNAQGTSIIPKKIHYCWFGNSEIPERFKNNIKKWQEICPDYEFYLWNEQNYDWKKNRYMKQAYECKKWGFVPDYARLDIINTYGGVYLDTDIEILKRFDDLLQYSLYCGFESKNAVNFGLGFGGVAGHPILEDMLDLYDNTEFINNDGSLNLTASPYYQTEILKKHGLICDGKTQKHDKFMAFSKEYFSPINSFGYGYVTDNSYSIHQYAATWFDDSQKADKERTKKSYEYISKRIEY